jgi:hypothetical protein
MYDHLSMEQQVLEQTEHSIAVKTFYGQLFQELDYQEYMQMQQLKQQQEQVYH